MSPFKRFLVGFAPTLVIALIYLRIVWIVAPSTVAAEATYRSNIVLTVFQPIFLPIIAGLLSMSLRLEDLVGYSKFKLMGALVFFTFLLGLAFLFVAADSDQAISDRIIEPIEWRETSTQIAFFKLDTEIRGALRQKSPLCPTIAASGAIAKTCYETFRDKEITNPPVTLAKHLGLASWWQRVLSAQAAVIAVVILASIVVYHWRGQKNQSAQEAIVAALALLTVWIPMRVYSDWFISYQSLNSLADYAALGIAGALIVMALAITYYRTFGEPLPKLFSIATGAASAVLTTIGVLVPEVLGPVGNWLSRVTTVRLNRSRLA